MTAIKRYNGKQEIASKKYPLDLEPKGYFYTL